MDVRNLVKAGCKSMDEKYPSPCISCKKKGCDSDGMCSRWRTRYLYRQKAINGFAKKYLIAPVTNVPAKDPCELCSTREYCHSICHARARWWDVQMEKLRKELGYEQHEE